MYEFLLRDSIKTLRCLKMELQGKVEERDIQLIDTAIENLLVLEDRRGLDAESALKILVLLAEILARIPSVLETFNVMVRAVVDATSH